MIQNAKMHRHPLNLNLQRNPNVVIVHFSGLGLNSTIIPSMLASIQGRSYRLKMIVHNRNLNSIPFLKQRASNAVDFPSKLCHGNGSTTFLLLISSAWAYIKAINCN
jgi:hypothetical protein